MRVFDIFTTVYERTLPPSFHSFLVSITPNHRNQNMIEWEPAIKELYGAGGERHVPLVPVLLRRLQERGRDANKNYAAELLAVMAQNGPSIQALFASTEPAQDVRFRCRVCCAFSPPLMRACRSIYANERASE